MRVFKITLFLSLLLFAVPAGAAEPKEKELPGLPAFHGMCDSIASYLSTLAYDDSPIYVQSIETIKAKKKKKSGMIIHFCKEIANYPFRDGDIDRIYQIVKEEMPGKYSSYSKNFVIQAGRTDLRTYAPQYFSATKNKDYPSDHYKFVTEKRKHTQPLVRCISSQYSPDSGLKNAHLAIWQSHGQYFEPSLDRWEWQRSRLFGIVEDRFTQSFVIPFLIPMLENAGAVVLMPRERDTNPNEVIVDNDNPQSGYQEAGKWKNAPRAGFANSKTVYCQGENPFVSGTARMSGSTRYKSESKLIASWKPNLPEKGEYGVYVSYQTLENSAEDARYLVRHSGGETWFSVNQTMCDEKWVFLGTFCFEKGNKNGQGVFLSNYSGGNNVVITADAVRFGGGMGNIARGTGDKSGFEPSGHPRYNEAAMYWLQWAGYPDSVYSASKFSNDYKDDIKARGNWVNYMKNNDNVPIDLSLAFHTDAGIRKSDSIVGTLAIYTSRPRGTTTYPSGEKRIVSKEFADIVQTQIVSDIRSVFNIDWTRRGLWDRSYAECSYPEVPAILLELLSHQNFWDMRYGLDPNFRFVVSRATYKGILKFHSYLNNRRYVVQPLPVCDFSVSISKSKNRHNAVLKWSEVLDPLEETAKPDYYIVYKRMDEGGFDNGTKFDETKATIEIKPGHLYSFKVVAVNEGGASFPSETLCAAVANNGTNNRKLLIVNNFNHIGTPRETISTDSTDIGFRYDLDPGIPYLKDISYCGPQYEFATQMEWKDDDAPGFGASHNTNETSTVAGNTFDFVASHAKSALNNGYDIVSSSAMSFAFAKADTANCAVIDIFSGRLDNTGRVFNSKTEQMLTSCAANGAGLIISGADVASNIAFTGDSLEIDWFKSLTSSKLMTWHASADGIVRGINNNNGLNPSARYQFFTNPNPMRFCVPHSDAIIPASKNCKTIYRYAGNNISAGTFRNDSCKVVTLGFPIEALATQGEIDTLMAELLRLFE